MSSSKGGQRRLLKPPRRVREKNKMPATDQGSFVGAFPIIPEHKNINKIACSYKHVLTRNKVSKLFYS